MRRSGQSIEVLPPHVIEKIAAGEMIERPASVLKELVENAIDAGATAIDASIESAGFSLIKVADNGCGMDERNLRLCLLPHATSKIKSAEDLWNVTSMGFRGEALASIAAISRICVTTSPDSGGLGYRIESIGGEAGHVEPVAHSQGTTVEVRDLFYNVPARKKFMKSQRSEQLAMVRVMEQVCIPFSTIHFTLSIDGKKVLDLPPCDRPFARIAAIAGAEFARGLFCCESAHAEGSMEAFCYVSSPEKIDARPRYQSLYVNMRRVDCDAITYSIRQAFEQFLGGNHRPSFFCFLTLDPSRVDVNVHPTKQQVKFEEERRVAGFIYAMVKEGIAARLARPDDVINHASAPSNIPHSDDQSEQISLRLSRPFSPENRFAVSAGTAEGVPAMSTSDLSGPTQGPEREQGDRSLPSTILPFPTTLKTNEKEIDRRAENTIQLSRDQDDRKTAWDLISCYQIHETYILAPIKKGILLIDQHAAHERVLFEQALDDMKRGKSESQQLLFPVVVELTSVEKSVVLSGVEHFSAFGFEIGDFGGNAVSVSAIPFFMRANDVDETVRAMVRYLLDEQVRDALHETEKRFAAAFACGAAIKAGQKLSQEEMNALVNSLFAAKNPYTCPHGRPTLVRISLEELGRRFLR